MKGRARRWLRVSAFLVCESALRPATGGPWTLDGVWHSFAATDPLAGLPATRPYNAMDLFAKITNRRRRPYGPREIEAQLWQRNSTGGARLLHRYRFPTLTFRPRVPEYMMVQLPALPITVAGWYEFLLVLDGGPPSTVLAREEVYLTP